MERLFPALKGNIGMFLGFREGYQPKGSCKERRKDCHILPPQGGGLVVKAKDRWTLTKKVIPRLVLKDLLVFDSDREG